jgi:2,3-bisphosphoglycerate-independent phosphoglycerate mutase
LDLTGSDWIFRLNFVTVGTPETPDSGLMLDHSAGAITDREARALLGDLVAYWKSRIPDLVKDVHLFPGVSYRNILVDSGGSRDYSKVSTTPPHAIPRQPWAKFLPSGGAGDGAGLLQQLMSLSSEVLPRHEVNLARMEQGLRPANMAWIWGQGTKPNVPSFHSRFGLRGAMITAVDLLAGISSYIGWERLAVPGLTSYHDNDYAAQGRATLDAIDRYDIVCCHVEAPDEASHQGDAATKVAALESIDHHIVGPVSEKLRRFGDPEKNDAEPGWRIMVLPDHYTLVSTRKHDATPVPFMIAGAWVRSMVERGFNESDASSSDLRVAEGSELMEYFLRGGLATVRARTR